MAYGQGVSDWLWEIGEILLKLLTYLRSYNPVATASDHSLPAINELLSARSEVYLFVYIFIYKRKSSWNSRVIFSRVFRRLLFYSPHQEEGYSSSRAAPADQGQIRPSPACMHWGDPAARVGRVNRVGWVFCLRISAVGLWLKQPFY